MSILFVNIFIKIYFQQNLKNYISSEFIRGHASGPYNKLGMHFCCSSPAPLWAILDTTIIPSRLWMSLILFIQTLALYQSFTYLLTYLKQTGFINGWSLTRIQLSCATFHNQSGRSVWFQVTADSCGSESIVHCPQTSGLRARPNSYYRSDARDSAQNIAEVQNQSCRWIRLRIRLAFNTLASVRQASHNNLSVHSGAPAKSTTPFGLSRSFERPTRHEGSSYTDRHQIGLGRRETFNLLRVLTVFHWLHRWLGRVIKAETKDGLPV